MGGVSRSEGGALDGQEGIRGTESESENEMREAKAESGGAGVVGGDVGGSRSEGGGLDGKEEIKGTESESEIEMRKAKTLYKALARLIHPSEGGRGIQGAAGASASAYCLFKSMCLEGPQIGTDSEAPKKKALKEAVGFKSMCLVGP